MVRIILHGHLRQFAPNEAKVLEVDAGGRSARDVLTQLGIPADEAAAVVVAGEQEELDRVLRDGETLEVIGAITGGSRPKFPIERADVLLAPERRSHLDPARALGEFGLHGGAVFADLGCGPGFFTIPAAKIVGPRGRVYAADVQPEMLARVREAAAANNLENIETSLVREYPLPEGRYGPQGRPAQQSGWAYDFGIRDATVDLALVAFVLHETEDPARFLHGAAELLKRSGRIALLQWQKRDTYAGPAVQARMTPDDTLAAIRDAGLRAQEAPSLDPDHYAFLVRP